MNSTPEVSEQYLTKFISFFKKTGIIEIRYILLLFFSTRLVLTIIGIFSRSLLDRQFGKQYIWSQHLWLDIWGVWDTFWYMDIAANGYSLSSPIPNINKQQANYAFFPLYPMLMRGFGKLIGDRYYLAGIIISNVCLIIAAILLYKLVRLDSSKKIALASVKYLFLFPTAFILSGVFTESLYLALTILCFYLARKRKWLFVGISGFFLALTRNLGVLIAIPVLYEYLKGVNFKVKEIRINVFFILLIPLGLSIFAFYNYHLSGDLLAFKNNLSAWNRESTNPLSALMMGIKQGLFKSNMRRLLEVSFAIVSLLTLNIFCKKINLSYWIFGMYSILIPLSAQVDSIPRYVLPIFPLYLILAQLSKDRYLDQILTISLGLIQGFLMVFWSCGFALVV